ncbi:Uncharacterised protein [Klebsiella pneumoniae subsp. ozaenae]|uniref:Uncharacterized protein n=1 Tax=Klebsiella pneumoniae subsp. ozaenae TaxID=574 RepID=A0A378B8N3_KLEPO|nr:Uncharacterised protein [Klebsiella pneumoniae subsp. ozaenae]VFS43086.1 Uncharacterised protein [Serratia liquefaciens]
MLHHIIVFPTHVGVFLHRVTIRRPTVRLPHARGGVSKDSGIDKHKQESSPRTWGCFLSVRMQLLQGNVFPTHVGVFLYFKFIDLH